jgi:hypothetical protein
MNSFSFIPRDMLQRLIDSQLLKDFVQGANNGGMNTVPFQLNQISNQLNQLTNVTQHNTPQIYNQAPQHPMCGIPPIPSIPSIPTIDIPSTDYYNY